VRRQVQASAGDSNGIIWKGRFVCLFSWYLCSELQRLRSNGARRKVSKSSRNI
jgi:hypothetical protein